MGKKCRIRMTQWLSLVVLLSLNILSYAQVPECLPTSDLGSDIRICTGSSVVLNPGNNSSNTSYQWSTGATSQSITVNQSGVYWVTLTNPCGTITDSIEVIVDFPTQPNFGGTLGLCPQNSDTLFFTLPDGISYVWSTGHQGQTLAVSSPGTYWGEYTNACGTFTESFNVVWSNEPIFDLGPDTTVCSTSGFTLSVPNNLGSVSWNTGSQSNRIFITTTGWYSATVTNNCGSYTDSVFVTMIPTPVHIIDDTIGICAGSDVQISAFSSLPANTTVNWSNNTTGNNTTYTTAGQHFVILQGPCINDTIPFYIEEVTSLPPINLSDYDTIVKCGDVVFDIGEQSGSTTIEWYNGSSNEEETVSSTALVWVTLTNACGSVSDTVMVYTYAYPDPDYLPDSLYICPADLGSYVLQYPPGDSMQFQWSNGSTSSFTTVSDTGLLTVLVYNMCDTIEIPIFVDTIPPMTPFELPSDTTFCEGEELELNMEDTLSADTLFAEYYWFWNGNFTSGSPSVTINQSGVYKLIKTNTCDSIIDEFTVTVIPTPKEVMDNRIHICFGDSVVLQPDTNGSFFQWSNGHPALNQVVTQSGNYAITIGNQCDTIVDEAEVVVEQPFPFYSTIDTIAICEGSVLIEAPIPNARYEWSNGTNRSNLRVHASGKYWVKIMNACDTVVDTTTVLITGPPSSILGNQVTLCRGNALVLDAQNFGSTYMWSTGDTTRRITVSDEGTYYVDIENPCGFYRDSINVILADPVSLSLGNDTVGCEGDSLVLDATNPFSTYDWSTGDTSSTITVFESGKYYVTVTNACGSRVDSVHVTFLDVPVFDLDTVFRCVNTQSITVEAPDGVNQTYTWSTGETTKRIEVSSEGYYWLTIDNGCFSYTDTFLLVEEYPLDVNMSPDTVLCKGETLLLSVDVPGRVHVQWNTGHIGRSYAVTETGNYSVRVRNSCGEYYDTVRVWFEEPLPPDPIEQILCWNSTYTHNLIYEYERHVLWDDGDTSLVREFVRGGEYPYLLTNACGVFEQLLVLNEENCDCPFFVPNSFTPDGDGINDLFKYGYDCNILQFQIQIFSRWGDLVFTTSDPTHYWDGTKSGRPMQTGAYSYVINLRYSRKGQSETKDMIGVVNLIR